MQIRGISDTSSVDGHADVTASSLSTTSFGIHLTGTMSAGFTLEISNNDILLHNI